MIYKIRLSLALQTQPKNPDSDALSERKAYPDSETN